MLNSAKECLDFLSESWKSAGPDYSSGMAITPRRPCLVPSSCQISGEEGQLVTERPPPPRGQFPAAAETDRQKWIDQARHTIILCSVG